MQSLNNLTSRDDLHAACDSQAVQLDERNPHAAGAMCGRLSQNLNAQARGTNPSAGGSDFASFSFKDVANLGKLSMTK